MRAILFRTDNYDMRHFDAVMYPHEDLCMDSDERNAKKLIGWFIENHLRHVVDVERISGGRFYVLTLTDPHAQTMAKMFFDDGLFDHRYSQPQYPGKFFKR